MNTIDLSGPSVWPAFPRDATFASVLIAAQRYSGLTPEHFAKKYFQVKAIQHDILAFRARTFAERAFGGS